MLLFYTLWSNVESGSKEVGDIRASPSSFWSSCASFDRSLFTLWVLFSEKGAGWTSKVSSKPTPSASVSHIILVWGPCCHLLEILVQPWELVLLLDAGPPCRAVSGGAEDGTCCAGVGGSSRENSSLGSQMERGRSRVMLSHKSWIPGSKSFSNVWVCWYKASRSRIEAGE